MSYVFTFFRDLFSGSFDSIMPVGGIFIAIALGITFFFIRFNAYQHNRKKRQQKESPQIDRSL